MVSKNKDGDDQPKNTSKRVWERVKKQKHRAVRTTYGGILIRDNPNNHPVVISDEEDEGPPAVKGDQKATIDPFKLLENPVPISPPREPGFVYEDDPPFKDYVPVVQEEFYDHVLKNMEDADYMYYLNNHVFEYEPEPLTFVEKPLPPPPPPTPVIPFIRPPVDFTRFFAETYSSASSNYEDGKHHCECQFSDDSGPGYCPSPPRSDSDASLGTAFSSTKN